MSRLILPPGVMPQTPDLTVRQVVDMHNRAMAAMHPEQRKAVDRIILATVLANHLLGRPDAPAEQQREAATAALAEVFRREAAEGKLPDVVMWSEPPAINPDDLADAIKRTT